MKYLSVSIATAALLCVTDVSPLRAEAPYASDGQISNAALVYWQAFAMLPQFTDEEMELLKQVEEGDKPVGKLKDLLAGSKTAISLASNVGSQTACQWEIVERGPHTLLPHLGKARLLARLMVLQALVDADQGNSSAAVEKLASALLVARNVDEGVLLQMLVGDVIESHALNAAQKLHASLDDAGRRQFAEFLAKLPPRATLAKAMIYERDVFAEWLRPLLLDDPQTARKEMQQLLGEDHKEDAAAVIAGSRNERLRNLQAFRAAYEEVIAATQLPKAEVTAALVRVMKNIGQSKNPLIRLLMPAVERAYERHAQVLDDFQAVAAKFRQ